MDVGVPVSPGGEEMLAASAAMDERDDDLLDDDDALDDDDDDDTLNLSDDDDDDDADDGKRTVFKTENKLSVVLYTILKPNTSICHHFTNKKIALST